MMGESATIGDYVEISENDGLLYRINRTVDLPNKNYLSKNGKNHWMFLEEKINALIDYLESKEE